MTRFLRLSLTAALGLTACGDDSDGATTTAETDPSSGSTTAATSSNATSGGAETTAPDTASTGADETSSTDGPTPAVPPFAGGERLIPRIETAPDGTQRFAGFHDSQLDQDCVFVQTDGDTRHCLPAFFVGGVARGEEGCSGPSVPLSSCSTPSEITTREVVCGDVSSAMAWSVGSSCGPANRVELEPLPLSRYVAGQPSTSVTVAGLRWTRIEAEDGAVFTEGPEAIDGPSCFASVTWPDACQPLNMSFVTGSLHADATCSGDARVTSVFDDGCDPPTFARGADDAVYRLVRPWDGPLYSGTGPGDCNETTVGGTAVHYVVEPARPDVLSPLGATVIGEERLQSRVIVHPETDDIVAHTGWYDRELGLMCTRSTAPSGQDVCAPFRSNSPTYADPACTDLLVRGGDGPGPRTVFVGGACSFGNVQGVAFPGESYDGPTYAFNTEGDCTEVGTAAPPRHIAQWIDADDLPQLAVE